MAPWSSSASQRMRHPPRLRSTIVTSRCERLSSEPSSRMGNRGARRRAPSLSLPISYILGRAEAPPQGDYNSSRIRAMDDLGARREVWIATAFFVASGLLELGCAAFEVRPLAFWPLWDAAGRA